MTIDNIPGRAAATVCAVALGLGGTSLLFGDVIFGAAEFTQKHFQTICVVIATTTAWMATTSAFKNRHGIAGFGFLILALAASGVIVWYSLGRQTEGQMLSTQDHDKAVEKQSDLVAKRADAAETLAQRQAEADKVCKKYPDGRTCRGARVVAEFWAGNLAGLQAQLDALKVKPADPSAEALGNLASSLGRNGQKAKALSMLVMPYVITILFEFGFTMSLHYVFRPSRRTRQLTANTGNRQPETMLADVSQTELTELRKRFTEPAQLPSNTGNRCLKRPDKRNHGGNGGGGFRVCSKTEAEADLITRLALGETVSSQDELAQRWFGDGWQSHKGTVSKWLKDWERRQLIPARQQIGRQKRITATA